MLLGSYKDDTPPLNTLGQCASVDQHVDTLMYTVGCSNLSINLHALQVEIDIHAYIFTLPGLLSTITPHGIRMLRSLLNDSIVDVMYYMSPRFGPEVGLYSTSCRRVFEHAALRGGGEGEPPCYEHVYS